MKMRQSFSQFEDSFREHAVEDREERERLRAEAIRRGQKRRVEKVNKHGTLRFFGLVAAIIGTSVAVTFVMFEALARVAG